MRVSMQFVRFTVCNHEWGIYNVYGLQSITVSVGVYKCVMFTVYKHDCEYLRFKA